MLKSASMHAVESVGESLLNNTQIGYNMAMDKFKDLAKEKGLAKHYYKILNIPATLTCFSRSDVEEEKHESVEDE